MLRYALATAALFSLATAGGAAPANKMAPATNAHAGAKMAATTTKSTMVHTTTRTGKKVTYDCSKAGNKNKAACKGK